MPTAMLNQMKSTRLKRATRLLALAGAFVFSAANALAEDAHAAGAADDHAPRSLMDVRLTEALWVVIIFVIMLVILYKTAWKNVLAGLKAREAKIRSDIEQAESSRIKALAHQKDYQTQLATAESRVREILATAQADAERVAAQIRARGETEAQESRERATREIETAKKQALSEIYDQTATLATSVAEKILGRNLNADDQRDLVKKSLQQLKDVNQN